MKNLTCDYCLKPIASKADVYLSQDYISPESKSWIGLDDTQNGIYRALHIYHRACATELSRQADGHRVLAPKEISFEKALRLSKGVLGLGWFVIVFFSVFLGFFMSLYDTKVLFSIKGFIGLLAILVIDYLIYVVYLRKGLRFARKFRTVFDGLEN